MNDLSLLHILDLALNSIHANARNVLISIEQNTQEQLLTLVVEDNGDGMEQSVLQRALEPGFTTKEKGLGGMGLPRLSETVQNMQGTLLLESEAGWGTRVKATFHTGGRDALLCRGHGADHGGTAFGLPGGGRHVPPPQGQKKSAVFHSAGQVAFCRGSPPGLCGLHLDKNGP